MRKIWIIATAAAAVAFAGCNRETDAPAPEAGVFRATIEIPSRVAFSDEGTFSWQEGDAIAVSTNAGFKTFTLASGAGSASGTFQGELVDVTSATVAVYPAAAAKDDATVTLPAEYAWKEGQTNAVMFCEQVSLTEVNNFKHLGGIIKITYSEIPADANALVFKAEAKITGDFAIADGKIAAGAGTDEVKVTFAAGSNPAAFYIPVPTGEYKFSVELQKDGAAVEGTKIATTNPIKVERKSLILMDPIGGVQAGATIKDFATEFVKVIDIWEATVGEIKMHSSVDATPNAHYIPDETTITVGDKTYNTADMYETASRCYLLVRGYNGLDTENYGAGKIAALEGGAQAMSTTEVPATHDYTWGSAPYNELGTYDIATGEGTGNNGHLIKIVDGQAVHSQVDVTILDNQVMRALNYSHGKDISNMCTYPRDPITNYAGSFSAKRALLTYAFFFKYMLDNNLDKADGIGADVAIRSELFGDEAAPEPTPAQRDTTWLAEWWINDADKAKLNAHYAEEAKEPGTSLPNVAANAAGNGGQYVEPNKSGAGRIEFYNAIDKTEINPKARVKRTIGAMAITEFGTWIDDYWLMTANPSAPVAAGEDIMVFFAMRANSKNTPKYWLAEIKDGNEWKPLLPTKQATFNGKTFNYNVEVFFDIPNNSEVSTEVDVTYTLTQTNSEIVVRITCMSLKMAGGTNDVPTIISDSVDGATENPVIMLVGERTNKNGKPVTRHTGIAILK